MAHLTAGQLIANDYRLLRELGRGGFGVVWHAEHMRLSREVAVKMIHGEALLRVPDAAARFMREVELAKQLEHPNVVRMYDYGSLPDQSLFMVMEFIKGEELKQILIQGGPLGAQRTTTVICQVLDALSEAHSLGIIHRDLKPANIMMTSKGLKHDVVKLLDFGIAKALAGEGQHDLTGTGAGYGTPHYMAPEVVMGRPIGPYTDLYAIGLMMLECLTGQRAVVGNTPHEVALKQVMEEVAIPAHIAHTGLGAILRRAMAKDPAHRYQSAAEMFHDIQQADSFHIAAHTPLSPVASPATGNVPDLRYLEFSSAPNTGSVPSGVQNRLSGPQISGPVPQHSGIQSAPRQPSYDSLSGHSFPPRSVPPSALHSNVHSLSNPDTSGPLVQQRSSGGRGTVILLSALVAFVAVLGAVAYVLLSGSDEKGEEPEKAAVGEDEPVTLTPEGEEATGEVVNRIPSVQELPEDGVAPNGQVVVQIESDVKADVIVGDEIVGQTPFEIAKPKDTAPIEYTLAYEGREPVKLAADFAKSRVYFVTLPMAEAAPPVAKAASSAKPKATQRRATRRRRARAKEKGDGEAEKPAKRTFRRIGREESGSDVDVPAL